LAWIASLLAMTVKAGTLRFARPTA
jgi:uncharacterized membrane protein YhhN